MQMIPDPHNTLFSLAADFINFTSRSVFLTGKAGTGKTTFLKYIKNNTAKQVAVVAPTGVAAINASGVTLHSFFQLPFTPFVPQQKAFGQDETVIDKHSLIGRIKLTRERRQVLQQLELLIIDEISMVRCDVLDAIDAVLRYFRNRNYEAFGGVQVLLIGDMFQLPPVVVNEEWRILSAFYNSPYFFDSKVIQQQNIAHIELNKIYRQNEQEFIDLLNKVRNNQMDSHGFALLNKRYNPSFKAGEKEGYIILTTHNNKADEINREELEKLKERTVSFKAIIEGEFSEKSYPAEVQLQLKVGAQVMFIKNDSEKVRRYFNGKIGMITKIETDFIYVQCKNEADAIEVRKEKWENIRYSFNSQSQTVEEEVAGSFTQFPLRLAWAITIHKSQGLTFEKAVIDAGAAFASGQVYVALSRCTTLSGIVLKSNITNAGLINDNRIVAFAQHKQASTFLLNELDEAKKIYQSFVITNLFYFTQVATQLKQIMKLTEEHANSFNEATKPWLESIELRVEALNQTAKKFQNELKQLFQQEILPEHNETLQRRIGAACNYFYHHLESLQQILTQSPAVTDSKQYALVYNDDLKEMYALLSKKNHEINSCKNGFNLRDFQQQQKQFVHIPLQINAYAGSASAQQKTQSKNPALHKQLRELRDKICEEQNAPVYIIASSNTLTEMADYLPQNSDELLEITGFGKAKIEKHGLRFLAVILNYCHQCGLSSLVHTKPGKSKRDEKKKPKPDTKEETFNLYKQGKTVAEISEARRLTTQTIEGHLAHFVQQGLISIDELVTKEKLVLIEPVLETFQTKNLIPIKERLGNSISYGEIKITLAWKEFKKSRNMV